MSIKDLSDSDFSYWVDYNRKDIDCHQKEFLDVIDPDLMRAFYRGYRSKQFTDFVNSPEKLSEASMVLTKVFTAGNTILPQLFYQQPKKYCTPAEGAGTMSAALMTAALNHSDKATRQKQENQNAVMNAYFFGLGWKKIGYQMKFYADVQSPESQTDPDETSQAQTDQTEMSFSPRPVRHEGLVNASESSLNVLVDHKGTLYKSRCVTHRIKRTLHDLRLNARYEKEVLDEVFEKFKYTHGSRFDERDIELDLNEKMIEFEGGVWILSFVDQMNKPLRYDKAINKGRIPWEPLALTNEPDVRYPISYMNVGGRVQDKIDKVASLMYEIISRSRNQIGIWDDALSSGQKQALMKNVIGGILRFKRPITDGVIREIRSSPVSGDISGLLQILMQNSMEVFGSTEQRVSGRSGNKTLGQDEFAEMGAQIREGGMQDKIRDWMVNQMEHEGAHLQQFSNSTPLKLMLTQKDFWDADAGRKIKDGPLEFMTQKNPMPLSKFIQGNFLYSINIYEATKPNPRALAKEYDEFMMIYSNPVVDNALLERGKRVRIDLVAEARAHTFQSINAEQFIEDLDPKQMAAIQVRRMMEKSGGMIPGGQQPAAEPAVEPVVEQPAATEGAIA